MRPSLDCVPRPQPKPKLLTIKLDNPINQRYLQVFEQAYEARHEHHPWTARVQTQGAEEVRIKAADVQTVFADPQHVAQSVFGPMLRIAQNADDGLRTHAQVPATHVRHGDSWDTVARRHAERVEPFSPASPENAQRLLGALIEASAHPQVHAALRELGHGSALISVASKELLNQAMRATGKPERLLTQSDPAVFLSADVTWPRVQADAAEKTRALTAYLRASDPVDGALDFFLRAGIRAHETRLKANSQRENLSTLAVVQQLLSAGVADYAQARDLAAWAYPEGVVQASRPQKTKVKKPKVERSGDFKLL